MPVNFQRSSGEQGLEYLTCRALPVPHGFSLRHGGISQGPWASLNLGSSAGDDPQCVANNKARWAAAFNLKEAPYTLHQVHGAIVQRVQPDEALEPGTRHGDALVNASGSRAIGVYTADCVPILLASGDGKVVGAVHAGWRGTVAGVAAAAIAEMQQEGVLPEHVVAAMGPAIGACCFAVGSEVVAAFAALPWFRPEIVIQDAGGPRIDLYAAIRLQLLAAGLHTHHIYTSDMCTVCHPVDCYSWRRDRGQTGRHLAMIQRRYS